MKRRKSKTKTPQIRLVGWQAPVGAALAAASLASAALAGPGDLDPSFGDVGRVTTETPGFASLWSVDVRDDDSVLFGGGGELEYYGSYFDDFVGGLLPDGSPDVGFAVPGLDAAAIYDTVLQSDGKLVGVGVVQQPDGKQKLLVFRSLVDGARDESFGLGGITVVSDGSAGREAGYSVAIDGEGRIVVAGERSDQLLVVRLLPDGMLDPAFGTAGVYLGPESLGATLRVAVVPAGGYRVSGSVSGGMGWDCKVTALTAAGAVDTAFGVGGSANPTASDAPGQFCSSLAVMPDGRTVVGGQDQDSRPFVSRLLVNGTPDPAFSAAAVADRLSSVSALAVGAAGKVVVAGTDRLGFLGAQVLRLQPDGALDSGFGQGGVASVDPAIRHRNQFAVADLRVANDGSVVLAGNTYSWWEGNAGFVARLIGDSGGGSPGVLSIVQSRVLATEAGGSAVLKVRRNGGSAGAIAVSYATRAFPWISPNGASYSPGDKAVPGDDYGESNGRLTWADGDTSEREIRVPVNTDAASETPEWFAVVLESPEGGAGLGLHGADVEIAGASYPHGDFSLLVGAPSVREGSTGDFFVYRNHYSEGEVSVTVRVAAGSTATPGDDFRGSGTGWQDVVLTWADGETAAKYVPVHTVVDSVADDNESVMLELVSATGGALVSDRSRATLFITSPSPPLDNDPPKSRSGGGSFGALGVMLLALGGALRRLRKPHGGVPNA